MNWHNPTSWKVLLETYLPAGKIHTHEQGHLYKLFHMQEWWHEKSSTVQLEKSYSICLTIYMVMLLNNNFTKLLPYIYIIVL